MQIPMISRVIVSFEDDERTVLQQMSEMDRRPPRDQIRHLVWEEARRRNLIETKQKNQAVSEHKATRNDPTSDPRQV